MSATKQRATLPLRARRARRRLDGRRRHLHAAVGVRRATGGLGALIAWSIAGTGMLMLAFVFQTLSRRRPDLDAGIYAYAKAGFGNYLGFVSALGYWIACCLADVACLILIKATLGQFFPIFGDGSTPVAILGASGCCGACTRWCCAA